MKKNFRFILVAVLAVLLLCVCTMAVSAAEAAQADAVFEIVDAEGAHVWYCVSLDRTAMLKIDNNYTVKLLKDYPVSAQVAYSIDKTYTIDGGSNTIAFSGIANPGGCGGVVVGKGTVTIKDVKITAAQNTQKSLITNNISGNGTGLTLENVILEGGSTQLLINTPKTTLITGANTSFKNAAAGTLFNITPSSAGTAEARGVVTVETGVFESKGGIAMASGADLIINGGTYTAGSTFFQLSDSSYVSALKITAGTFTGVNTDFINYSGAGACTGYVANDNAVVNMSGGNVYLTGLSTAIAVLVSGSSIEEHPVVKVSGGTIDCWPDKEEAGSGVTGDNDIFQLNNSDAHLVITGGRFIGSRDMYSCICTKPEKSPVGQIDVTGGVFTGARAWVRTSNGCIINLGGTCDFSEPGVPHMVGTSMTDSRGIWLHNGSGRDHGVVTISGGTFTIQPNEANGNIRLCNAAGADVIITGGTFNIGSPGIAMSDGDFVSRVYIHGGTFYGNGYDYIIGYTAGRHTNGDPGGCVEITGGTFITTGNCEAIRYNCSNDHMMFDPANYKSGAHNMPAYEQGCVKISGGTFITDNLRCVAVRNCGLGYFEITGGTFEGTAARILYIGDIDQVNITGGTFKLSALEGGAKGNATDAVVSIEAAKTKAKINFYGGTFINERAGVNAVIRCTTVKTDLNFEGATIKSKEAIKYFVSTNSARNNISILPGVCMSQDGYYVAYTAPAAEANAPTLSASPAIAICSDGNFGIRYTSTISAEKYEALKAEGEVTLGTLVATYDSVKDFATIEEMTNQLKTKAVKCLDIKAEKGLEQIEVTNKVKNEETGETEEVKVILSYTFSVVLTDITDANKGYVAISYAKVGDTYYYSNFNSGAHITSLKKVAQIALDDVDEKTEAVIVNAEYESVKASEGIAYTLCYKYGSISETVTGYSRYNATVQNRLLDVVK